MLSPGNAPGAHSWSSPKGYEGSLSVGDMGGWLNDTPGGSGLGAEPGLGADQFGYSTTIMDEDMMGGMMNDAPPAAADVPASADDVPPGSGRLSIDAMPQGMLPSGGLDSIIRSPAPIAAGSSISGSPVATSETAISPRFSGKTQQNIRVAAPAPAKKSSGRRKAARDHSEAGRVSKKPWNDDEDMKVLELVHMHGAKNWPLIAEHLPGRVGKQCRER